MVWGNFIGIHFAATQAMRYILTLRLRLPQFVDYNTGVFMYKVFYKDVPKIFHDYLLLNY